MPTPGRPESRRTVDVTVSREWDPLSAAGLSHRWRERTALEYVAELDIGETRLEYATPHAALRHLRDLAWGDLAHAQRRALNGRWSIETEGHALRVIGLTLLVGPIGWESVQADLIVSGLFEAIHERAGCPTPLSDADRARAQAVIDRRSR